MFYTAESVRDIPVGGQRLCGLTWSSQTLWFSDAGREQILAVDPQTGEIMHWIGCPEVRTDLTALDGHLLQVVGPERRLRVIDPDTGETVEEFANPRPGGKLCGLEATNAGVWMGYKDPPVLDLRSRSDFGLIDSIPVNQEVAGVTVAGHFIAFADYLKARIYLLDPVTKQVVVTIGVKGNPTGLTWDGRRIWYCDHTTVQLRAVEVTGIVSEG